MNFEEFKANQLLVLPPNPDVDFSGKTIIITGANAGIGYELVRYYLKQNAKQIVMVCRSIEKAEKAKQKLLSEINRKDDGVITIELMNMLSFTSVKACADKLNATLDSVHVIHHNAGMACVPKQLSEDGYETVAQTNVLSASQFALLTHPLLKKTSENEGVQTRSVFTCTDGIYFLPDDVSQKKHKGVGYVKHLAVDRQFTKEEEIWHYCATKNYLANFAREYAKHVSPQNVSVWLAAPGLTQTEFAQKSHDGVLAEKQKDNEETYSAKPRTPEEGTKTVILASVDDPKKYNWTPEKGDAIRLSNCKEQPAPESTADRQERREIYQEIQQILANHLSGIPTELKA